MSLTKAPYRDRVQEANGLKLHYLEWGDAGQPPMVLLHGLTGHAHTWDTFAQAAAERYRIIALDQRGHGDSQWARTHRTADMVADLKALTSMLQVRPFTLIGLSMGAHNTMAYASEYPDDVAKAVLVDLAPQYVARPNPLQERIAEAARAGFDALEETLALAREGNPIARDHELWLRTFYGTKRREDGKLIFKYDPSVRDKWEPENLWDKIGRITAPTLILRGSESQTFAREDALRMEQAIPRARFVEVPGAGHPINNDQPELFFTVVWGFLHGEAT